MIDKHAGEVLADRLVQQHGADGRIDAARHREQHLLVADLCTDRLDLVLDVRLDVQLLADLRKSFLLCLIHSVNSFRVR